MDIQLHAYTGTTTPLYNFINLHIQLYDHTDVIHPDPDCIHYWLSEVVYEHTTLVENIVPRGFFDGTPNSFIVVQLCQEGISLDPGSPTRARIDQIVAQVPADRILILANTEHQTEYFHRFYPNLTNIITFNFLELMTRSMLPEPRDPVPEDQRRFLFLNRRNYLQRTLLFSKLWRDENFVNTSYTSFNPGTYWDTADRSPDGTICQANIDTTLGGAIRDLKHHIPDIDTWLPTQTFPQLPERYSVQNPFDYDFFSTGLAQAHADTAINVVVESNAYAIPQQFFSTEKLYRPIASAQAFIVYAQPGYYANLKRMGYATYEQVFGEKHDLIANDFERADSVARTVLRLSRMESGAFENLMQAARRIRKHNYRLFMKRTSIATVRLAFTGAAAPLKDLLRYSPF